MPKCFPVEFSFALPDYDSRTEVIDEQSVRIFTRISIPEVSPVLLGAGIDTHLTSIKSQEGETMETKDKSMEFAKQLDDAVVAVESVCARAKEIRNLREDKGKDELVSRQAKRRLKALHDALTEVISDVGDLLTDPNDEANALAKSFDGGNDGEDDRGLFAW